MSIAEGLHPALHGRAHHWVGYGRVLARLRGRREDAVRALPRAETMNPVRVRRNPLVRNTIAVLLQDARRDAVDQELHEIASQARVPKRIRRELTRRSQTVLGSIRESRHPESAAVDRSTRYAAV